MYCFALAAISGCRSNPSCAVSSSVGMTSASNTARFCPAVNFTADAPRRRGSVVQVNPPGQARRFRSTSKRAAQWGRPRSTRVATAASTDSNNRVSRCSKCCLSCTNLRNCMLNCSSATGWGTSASNNTSRSTRSGKVLANRLDMIAPRE